MSQKLVPITAARVNPFTEPEEDKEKVDKGDPEGWYANGEHLKRVLALRRALVDTAMELLVLHD